jgi:hypothetical protein
MCQIKVIQLNDIYILLCDYVSYDRPLKTGFVRFMLHVKWDLCWTDMNKNQILHITFTYTIQPPNTKFHRHWLGCLWDERYAQTERRTHTSFPIMNFFYVLHADSIKKKYHATSLTVLINICLPPGRGIPVSQNLSAITGKYFHRYN